MALKMLGKAKCPYCSQGADVGVSRDGKGSAVHLLCRPCGVNIQAYRSGVIGARLAAEAARWYEDPLAPFLTGSYASTKDKPGAARGKDFDPLAEWLQPR